MVNIMPRPLFPRERTPLSIKYAPKKLPAGDKFSLQQATIFGALYHKLYTQSSAPEDGRNYRPKHVELIEISNRLLLLHLVGCLYYCISDARSHKHQIQVFIFFPGGKAVGA
jgi:hypothetical protein